MTINRVPKGVPTGGEFAEGRRSESATATLDEPRPLTEDDLQHVEPAVRSLARRYGVRANERLQGESLDDVRQTSYVEVLKAIREPVNGGVDNPPAYVHKIVAAQFEHAFRGNASRGARKGMLIFRSREAVLSNKLGRGLTNGEKRKLAADIRDNWSGADGERPPADFLDQAVRNQQSSTDDENVNVDSAPMARLRSAEDQYLAEARGEGAVDDKIDAFITDTDDEMATADKAMKAIDILAAQHGAPSVPHRTIPRRAALAARKTVKAHPGGFDEVLTAYRDRGDDTPATRALFAAWDGQDLTNDDRDAIADMYAAADAHGAQLWDTTLRKADKYRDSRVRSTTS